ncbi:MAG: SDR family NAD(P)-dependent oxidoreductase [Imperialibacter sp.]|uniref:SDR family NAD(P)-dependent oxidoreductase n=1 Tax=Imperialibacter sp. TaxID=2038411 RepID=UPI0032EB85E0
MVTQKEFIKRYGSWALITGASSGIGRAIALELAQREVNIMAVGRSAERLDALESEIQANYQVKFLKITADLGTQEGIERVKEMARQDFVGLFVHAAGLESHGAFTDKPLQEETALLQLNVQSTMQLTHHFAQKMTKAGRGGILLVSSLTGHMISPYFANYAASKAYVLNFGLSLRAELKQKGVDVSVLSPGLTDTPMSAGIGLDIDFSKTPMKSMSAKEVAEIALEQFPEKATIIPGTANRITSFIASRIAPQFIGKNNENMMRKAFRR